MQDTNCFEELHFFSFFQSGQLCSFWDTGKFQSSHSADVAQISSWLGVVCRILGLTSFFSSGFRLHIWQKCHLLVYNMRRSVPIAHDP